MKSELYEDEMESKLIVDGCGTKRWRCGGILHREGGPAVEYANGEKIWYYMGKRHREDGPAAEYTNGSKFWFYHGEFHREDGPAIEYHDGSKNWYYHGRHLSCSSQYEFERLLGLKAFW